VEESIYVDVDKVIANKIGGEFIFLIMKESK